MEISFSAERDFRHGSGGSRSLQQWGEARVLESVEREGEWGEDGGGILDSTAQPEEGGEVLAVGSGRVSPPLFFPDLISRCGELAAL